jgi:hypothetical protein
VPIEDYKEDLETAQDDLLREKLDLLGVNPDAFAALPSIVIEKQRRPVRINAREGFSLRSLGDAQAHSSTIRPDDLHRLKELTGVPQRAFDPRLDGPEYESKRSPKQRRRDDQIVAKLPERASFGRLSAERKAAVWATAQDLLYGPVDAALLDRPGYQRVVRYMLDLASELTVFVAPDLVVADGQSVQFSNYAVLYFTNVNVYGSGAIWLGEQAKLHAQSIKHL